MNHSIVHSLEPITLVGGGHLSADDLEEVLKIAPRVVAVDSGLDQALASGITPEAVIGDLDSVSTNSIEQLPVDKRHEIVEQDTTDFDKALRNISAPVIVAVGFCGGRLDHQLAALHTLLTHADRPCVLLGETEISFILPPYIALPMKPEDTVSLFPLVPVTGRSTGLEWPIDGLFFDPASRIGTSNRAQGQVELNVDQPGLLAIIPRRLIQPVVRELSRSDVALWPVPASRHKAPLSA